jgi:two-component system LytT family sensor kinase
LQPLVENAIKHGIEPLEAGGEITLRINRQNDQLIVRITDTGCGFESANNTAGSGTGVANVQARLSALFGTAASLVLEEHRPSGILATLTLPATAS